MRLLQNLLPTMPTLDSNTSAWEMSRVFSAKQTTKNKTPAAKILRRAVRRKRLVGREVKLKSTGREAKLKSGALDALTVSWVVEGV